MAEHGSAINSESARMGSPGPAESPVAVEPPSPAVAMASRVVGFVLSKRRDWGDVPELAIEQHDVLVADVAVRFLGALDLQQEPRPRVQARAVQEVMDATAQTVEAVVDIATAAVSAAVLAVHEAAAREAGAVSGREQHEQWELRETIRLGQLAAIRGNEAARESERSLPKDGVAPTCSAVEAASRLVGFVVSRLGEGQPLDARYLDVVSHEVATKFFRKLYLSQTESIRND